MKKFIIFLLLISFCGGDIEETSEPIETTQSNNEIETTSTTSSTSTSTSTTSSTSTSTTTTTTIPKEIYDKVSSLFFYEQSYLLSYNWEKEFKIVTTDEGCQERTEFFNDRSSNTLSNKTIDNLEKIFSKTINEITSDDILNMSRLTIDDSFSGYSGIGYLTCLQYFDAGFGSSFWGNDYRFLSNLTELRFLNCNYCKLVNPEVLYSLDNLEYLMLPLNFSNLSQLYNLENLRYIDAQNSRGSCHDYYLLNNLNNLKEVHLNGSDLSSFLNQKDTKNKPTLKISKSPSGKYLELLVEEGINSFFPDLYGNSGFKNKDYLTTVMNQLYEEIDDKYEVVIFIANQSESDKTYSGYSKSISNNEKGIGLPIYSSAECFGSKGRLRGNAYFPSLSSFFNSETYVEDWGEFTIMSGPLLHELLHLWGGADIIPYFQTRLDEPGAGGGHFGFSTGGVLGGFDNKSLIELGNNNYQVDYFDPVGNSIETSMSDLEKYILGLLPKEDLGPIYSFIGDPIVFDKYCTKTKGEEDVFSNCFNASEKITYKVSDFEDIFGKVQYVGKREISALVVLVTDSKVTDAEWQLLDEKVSWHISEEIIDDDGLNIFEASDGLLKLMLPKP